MTRSMHSGWLGLGLLSILTTTVAIAGAQGEEGQSVSGSSEATPIRPAASLATGLLLEPPLELAWFTRERFVKESSNIGAEKIQKVWTSPVKRFPPHQGKTGAGLSEDDVKTYMRQAKAWFDQGNAIPVSDVGLVSTQEDVIRQPMLNHIAAFENEMVRAYLLVQRTLSDTGWGYFSIVQDLTVEPPQDYFAQIHPDRVQFEATSCYKCHSSGPLAIHPAREDLVLDAKLAAALNEHIATQPRSQFFFPSYSPKPATGKPLTLEFCSQCHDHQGTRATLFQLHAHSIRVLVDFGYMPPDERLTPEQIQELKNWLEKE
ncbi:MAG: hypothetical protein R3E01_35325 [Pirellulaceae bacterium]|nr:hypothetical protein [Planctomycetales bacterium]